MAKKQAHAQAAPENHVLDLRIENATEPFYVEGSIKKAVADAKASSQDFWQVDRSKIHIFEDFNVRLKNRDAHKEKVRWLADQMKAHGYKRQFPLSVVVRREDGVDKFYVTDGHTRLEAFDLAISEGAELSSILPVVRVAQGLSMEDLNADLYLSNTGTQLQPYELGILCKRMVGFGRSADEIATRFGISVNYVKGLLLLLAAPTQVREMVVLDQIAATEAIKVLREHGDKALEVLAKGMENAKTSGKNKVTSRFLPEQRLRKAVTKAAPRMFEAIGNLRMDPSYSLLSEDLRSKLDALASELDERAFMEPEGDEPGEADADE